VTAAIGIVVEPRDRKIRPTNDVDAQFSLPYAVGLGIEKGQATLEEYAEPTMSDAGVLAVAERTVAVVRPEFDAKYPAIWPSTTSPRAGLPRWSLQSRSRGSQEGDMTNPGLSCPPLDHGRTLIVRYS
jgi:hypothetical protein